MPPDSRALIRLSGFNESKGGACTCYDPRHFSDPRCPIHTCREGQTCRVCGGVNGQHYSQCPKDPWR